MTSPNAIILSHLETTSIAETYGSIRKAIPNNDVFRNAVLELLEGTDPDHRAFAIELLAELPHTEENAKLIATHCTDSEEWVCNHAWNRLGEFGSLAHFFIGEAYRIVVEQADAPDQCQRAEAIRFLLRVAYDDYHKQLLPLMFSGLEDRNSPAHFFYWLIAAQLGYIEPDDD